MKCLRLLAIALAATFLTAESSSAALIKAVGDIQPRFTNGGAGGAGPTDASQVVSAAGVHAISYSGLISDFLTSQPNADAARPFIGFDQSLDFVNSADDEVAVIAYLDNLVMTVGNETIWFEDFESAALGAMSDGNDTLPGTVVQSANTLTMVVVPAPSGFTSASGNAVRIGSGPNAFSAMRPSTAVLSFTSVPTSTPYTLSFDLFIVPEPSALSMLGMTGLGICFRRKR